MSRPIEIRNAAGTLVFSVSGNGDIFSPMIETNSAGIGFFGKTPLAQASGAAQGALTDSTSGTTDGIVSTVATVVTGVDGTASNAASKADVDARLVVINSNFAELTTLVNALRVAMVNAGSIKGGA